MTQGNECSFYKKFCPRSRKRNLDKRRKVLKRCAEDLKYRKAIIQTCKRDILFFLNMFGWLYEPRNRYGADGNLLPKRLPFITWEHQNKAIVEIFNRLGVKDVGVPKSRGEGMSWMACYFALHFWLFQKGSAVGLVSRDESLASDSDNPDSLIWKILYALQFLPTWMKGEEKKDWKFLKSSCDLVNIKNGGASIVASSATGNVFRGGRKTWILKDEFAFFKPNEAGEALASSGGVTDSRLFVSTVNGPHTEFQRVITEASNMKVVRIDWKDNEVRNRGLYKFKDGKPIAIDPENNPLPEEYNPPTQEILDLFSALRSRGYDLEKGERSPWYDNECARPGYTPQRIAQEYDMDASGTQALVFDKEFFVKGNRFVEPPITVGNIEVKEDLKVDFIKSSHGRHKFWVPIDSRGNPPPGDYVFGCDAASGNRGAWSSDSAIVGIDRITKKQVYEFAFNGIKPEELGYLLMALGTWFGEAFIGWEHAGPGTTVTKTIIESKLYSNIYYREVIEKGGAKKTKKPGWHPQNADSRRILFDNISDSMSKEKHIIQSIDLLNECQEYVYINGKAEHARARSRQDEVNKGNNHGDRVIAWGVAVQCSISRPPANINEVYEKSPKRYDYGTFGHRHQEYLAELEKQDQEIYTDDIEAAYG